jgi:hypothetical protein
MISKDPRHYYPGLVSASADLWEKWVELYGDRFETVYYNVRAGAGVRPPPGYTPAMERAWWADTTKRLDAVAERENQTWAIEISERPGADHLGRLQLYVRLLRLYQGQNAQRRDVIAARSAEDFLIPTDIREIIVPALICRFMGADFRATIEAAGILIFQFPGAGYPKLPPQFLPSVQTAAWYPGAP